MVRLFTNQALHTFSLFNRSKLESFTLFDIASRRGPDVNIQVRALRTTNTMNLSSLNLMAIRASGHPSCNHLKVNFQTKIRLWDKSPGRSIVLLDSTHLCRHSTVRKLAAGWVHSTEKQLSSHVPGSSATRSVTYSNYPLHTLLIPKHYWIEMQTIVKAWSRFLLKGMRSINFAEPRSNFIELKSWRHLNFEHCPFLAFCGAQSSWWSSQSFLGRRLKLHFQLESMMASCVRGWGEQRWRQDQSHKLNAWGNNFNSTGEPELYNVKNPLRKSKRLYEWHWKPYRTP